MLLLLIILPAYAQNSTPNWPDWVLGCSEPTCLETPQWPPGDYPAYAISGTIMDFFIPPEPTTIHVDENGNWGGAFYTVTYDRSCSSASTCDTLYITYLVYGEVGYGEMPMEVTLMLKWSDWEKIVPSTPAATLTPGTTTPPPNTVTPPPPTPTPQIDCPADVIQQQQPSAEMLSKFPQNPVVRGQGGMGLIITYRATSFPVVRHYWVKVDNSHWGCVHVETGFEDDGRYGVSPCAAGWEGWETRWISDVRCEEKIEVIPDPIVASAAQGHARLRENSKRWIEGELQQRYPGARVKKPDWDVAGRVVRQGCYSDGRCILEAQVYFPFEDPGWYDVWANFRTTGTAYTPPRIFEYRPNQPQAVYLMDSTLLPNW
jgi:hypothetical protein